jgi:hypothetical protein
MVQKIKALRTRWIKTRPGRWIDRWEIACAGLWARFADKPISESTLEWMERNHRRLMTLAERKNS